MEQSEKLYTTLQRKEKLKLWVLAESKSIRSFISLDVRLNNEYGISSPT